MGQVMNNLISKASPTLSQGLQQDDPPPKLHRPCYCSIPAHVLFHQELMNTQDS